MSLQTGPIVDRVSDAFFALDSDWRFTYLNDTAAAMLDGTRRELIGRVLWDEFPETVESQIIEGFYRAREDQVSVTLEVYHQYLQTWFEARVYPDESGLSVYMRDVTEQKQRETELAQHSAAIEAMEDGVVTLDDSYHIVSLNSSIEIAFDLDRSALIGSHIEELTERGRIDSAAMMDIGQAMDEVRTGKADQRTVEARYVDANGYEGVCEIRLVPVEEGDATLAGVVRDITERHEYDRVVNSLHEITRWLVESSDPEEIAAISVHAGSDLLDLPISGIWLLDTEHGYLDPVAGTAGAHEEFGGLPRFYPGEGLAWDVFEAGEPQVYDDLHEVDGVYNPETPIRSEVIAPIGTHGVLMTGALEPNRFEDSDLELISTLSENTCAALDRAEREQVLRERTERLERQTERLEAIATVLSEDLKEELSSVGDALEAERSKPKEWQFPFSGDRVTETLDRTERLVNDVKEYARNATSVGQRTVVDLESAIDQALEQSALDRQDLTIEREASLRADRERFTYFLETIFDDVAGRSDGDVSITVSIVGVDDHTEGARGFVITDDAPIPATSSPLRLDQPDHPSKEAESTGDDAAGTESGGGRASVVDASDVKSTATGPTVDSGTALNGGLGLAVARAIAEAHGWTVSVSVDGDGRSRFSVRDVTTLEPA